MPPPAPLENDKQRHGTHPHHSQPPHPSSTSRISISRSPIRNITMESTHSTSSSISNPNQEAHPHTKPASTSTLPGRPPPRPFSQHREATQLSSREEPNTFEESFRLALHRESQLCGTQDGAIDTPTSHIQTFPHSYSEYEERTPLLNALYNPTSNPPTPSTKTTRPNPLPPLAKAKPSLSISLWHEVCHNSQYTRPAAEVLREALEVRYPVDGGGGGNGGSGNGGSGNADEQGDEEALLGRDRRERISGGGRRMKWRRWWRRR